MVEIKCERCGQIKPLGQYTKFEVKEITISKDTGGNPRFRLETKDIGEKRGLCIDCSIVINCRNYDRENERP